MSEGWKVKGYVVKYHVILLLAVGVFILFVFGVSACFASAAHDHSEKIFHKYVIPFPIAFYLIEFHLLIFWEITKKHKIEKLAFLFLTIVLLATAAAMVSGAIDAGGINKMVRSHALSAILLFSVNFVRWNLRRYYKVEIWQGKLRFVYMILLVFSLALTGITGHLGGQLVYA